MRNGTIDSLPRPLGLARDPSPSRAAALCDREDLEARREVIIRRLLQAYGHVRVDEAIRQLCLDALGIGQPEEVGPEEQVWLTDTLDLSGRSVADAALERLADIIAERMLEAGSVTCERLTRPATWCGPGWTDRP